jgi:sedoheptulose-bisphosphatase
MACEEWKKLTLLPHAGFAGLLCGVVWQEEFLTKATPDKNLIRLLICMGEAMRTIAFKVRTASCGGTACVNSFGDEQLAVDMLANKLLFEVWNECSRTELYCTSRFISSSPLMPGLCLQALEYSHVCKYACSEEVPELQDMGGPVEGTAISPPHCSFPDQIKLPQIVL